MNIQNKFSQILQEDNSKGVICFGNNITLKIRQLLVFANSVLRSQALRLIDEELRKCGIGSLSTISNNWNISGIDAEILEPNAKAWKKGKIRMRVVLEFCPEKSEEEQPEIASNSSPLDDIRKSMNK